MPPEKLLSCPFCGSNNKRPVVQKTLCVRPYVVMCFQCFAQTSEYNTEEEAMFAWNTRSPSPELVELRKDKNRLDWLESDEGFCIIVGIKATDALKKYNLKQETEPPLRTAIDEAMKEKK